MPLISSFRVNAPGVVYGDGEHTSVYEYTTNEVTVEDGVYTVKPQKKQMTFKVNDKTPRMGLMMVGLGGNNGTTLTGGILAHKHNLTWRERSGEKKPDLLGSVTQSTAIHLGKCNGEDIYVPFSKLLSMVDPSDLVISGWDLSNANMYEAVCRAHVYQPELCDKLKPYMEGMVPLPAIYDKSFIASNQEARVTNKIEGTKFDCYQKIRQDIRDFKANNKLDRVVVLWTATTERYSELDEHIHYNPEDFHKALETHNDKEISPSSIYCYAAMSEGCIYLNGSPQNTIVPALQRFAAKYNEEQVAKGETNFVYYCGDDFKSGQTKFKSMMGEFLIGSGMRLRSVASYNHLGNNDGLNLNEAAQFRSKEISKGGVLDDMIAGNPIVYDGQQNSHEANGKHPIDHIVVIKYVPFVGDSKRALDEYTSEIWMNGLNTIVAHNTCEDSLLAAPIMLDMALVAELLGRVEYKTEKMDKFMPLHPLLSSMSLFFKAPIPKPSRAELAGKGAEWETEMPLNALGAQRRQLEGLLGALAGVSVGPAVCAPVE